MSAPRAAILSIGDELIQGRHVDRNSATLSRWLGARGVQVHRHLTVDDDEAGLAAAIVELAEDHELVISTGGLGPTLDDVTRSASALAAGVPLVRDAGALAGLEQRFLDLGRELVASNLRQVDFPAGARVLANPHGTAPGFAVAIGGALHVALPGPPREMVPMLAEVVGPLLQARGLFQGETPTQAFYLFQQSESVFAEVVREAGDWMARGVDPLMSVTAGGGLLAVQLKAQCSSPASRASLAARADEFRALFRGSIYSEHEQRPAFVLGQLLLERGLTIATAESCTGGGIAAELTDVPGISAAFHYGWVTYANEAKVAELGLDPALFAEHGAVSEEVVRAMAEGAAKRAKSDVALAVSGIAGPGGGTDAKPVGLVWFGLSVGGQTFAFERRFPARDRESVRAWARVAGLLGLHQKLVEMGPDPVRIA
ncbi:MAG: nicotinamide-nucleotide amidohydrolase family protein [Planctomycetota bacterium]|nr:nicotinamide-nucleotide amidohydrolase family protein [Planctomycetota bacterium]